MRTWPHAPSKQVDHPGNYIVTSSTYGKALLFRSPSELDLQGQLLIAAEEFDFNLQAWAVFPNHYHIVGFCGRDGVRELTKALHGRTSRLLNGLHNMQGRTVWYRTWDTAITNEKSYLARHNCVHSNPVRHGVAVRAEDYPWCSAKWFGDHADRSFFETVRSFPIDSVNVYDEFDCRDG